MCQTRATVARSPQPRYCFRPRIDYTVDVVLQHRSRVVFLNDDIAKCQTRNIRKISYISFTTIVSIITHPIQLVDNRFCCC